MKISGGMINYYFHCKRQLWLSYNRINMELSNEDVRIGKVLHDLKFENQKNSHVKLDNIIEIDKITDEFIIEFKKSDSDINSAKYQILYYLYILKQKGINRYGIVQFNEINRQGKQQIEFYLTQENEQKLLEIINDIESLCSNSVLPVINDKKCKKCAYYEYCYI